MSATFRALYVQYFQLQRVRFRTFPVVNTNTGGGRTGIMAVVSPRLVVEVEGVVITRDC